MMVVCRWLSLNPIERAAEMYMHVHRTWNIRTISGSRLRPGLQIVIIAFDEVERKPNFGL